MHADYQPLEVLWLCGSVALSRLPLRYRESVENRQQTPQGQKICLVAYLVNTVAGHGALLMHATPFF